VWRRVGMIGMLGGVGGMGGCVVGGSIGVGRM